MFDAGAFFGALKTFASEGTDFIYAISMVVGLILGLMGIMDIIKKGASGSHGQEKSWGGIAGRLIAASCLITLANKLDMIVSTNGSVEPVKQALAYAQGGVGGGGGPLSFVWAALSMWVVFIGTAGFMKGFVLFDKASQGGHESGDKVWAAVWHIIGGALAINLFS